MNLACRNRDCARRGIYGHAPRLAAVGPYEAPNPVVLRRVEVTSGDLLPEERPQVLGVLSRQQQAPWLDEKEERHPSEENPEAPSKLRFEDQPGVYKSPDGSHLPAGG